MKIVLLRHGRTSLLTWPWVRGGELGSWIDAYDSAGISDMRPPDKALLIAGQCKVLVTSDLLRTVESARVLGAERPMISNELFREAGLPYGPMTFLKMPPHVWALWFRFLWSFGFKNNGDSIRAFRNRARSAAMLLISLAHKYSSVLLVGHGLINRYIACELLSAGWDGPERTKIRHWGFTEYIREA